MKIRIRSRLVNRTIDWLDDAFTWSSKILPPPKPVGLPPIFGYTVVWTDVGAAIGAVLIGAATAWYYGHWLWFVMVMAMMALIAIIF